jgi:hypothetical protein
MKRSIVSSGLLVIVTVGNSCANTRDVEVSTYEASAGDKDASFRIDAADKDAGHQNKDAGTTDRVDGRSEAGRASDAAVFSGESSLGGENSRFTNNGDGTVTDQSSGLVWMRCAAGQSGNDCAEGVYSILPWQNAVDYCDGLTLAGHNDWRLPSREELRPIAGTAAGYPTTHQRAFPGTPSTLLWTSSFNVSNPEGAWAIGLQDGYVDYGFKTNKYSAKCVRTRP